MKKFSVLLFLILIGTSVNAQIFTTWSEQTSGVTTQLTSASSFNMNNTWICGYSGVVLRTTNGGNNWVPVTGAPIPASLNLHCIFAIDAATVLVCGSGTASFVFRTTNAGSNWTQVFTETGGFVNSLLMFNSTNGFMYGDPVGGRWSLWKTTNGGVNWDSAGLYLPQAGTTEAGWNNAMFYDGVSSLWFGTNNTKVYMSSTNGTSWISQPTTGELNSYAIWFNFLTGLTGGAQLVKTTNGGTNWAAASPVLPGTGNIAGITGINPNAFWVVRQTTAVYFTSNSGANWASQYTAPAGNYRHITKTRVGGNDLYAVRTNGGISKAVVLISGVQKISTEIPEKFRLFQNYPNPFNPATNIKFAVTKTENVKLSVFDNLGREVKVLVNENMGPGTYEINFDASGLSSGIYFYKMTSGTFSDTKKMMILK